jgi:type VI secretion system secreted protein Hcp
MRKSLITFAAAAAVVAGLASAPMAGAADDYFLKVNGLGGEQTVGKITDAIAVDSFDWGAENDTSFGSESGGVALGKASFHELTITKDVDSTSPLLFQALSTGKPYSSMELVARKAGAAGAAAIYQRYYFGLAYVTSQEHSGDSEHIQETVTFKYAATGMTNVKQNANGSTTNVFQAWNVTTHSSALAIQGIPTPVSPYLF